MRTKPYTLAQITEKAKTRKPVINKDIYLETGSDVLFILDSDFRVLATNYCREFTLEHIYTEIQKGKTPAYIGICLEKDINFSVKLPEGMSDHQYEDRLIKGTIKTPAGINKANRELVRSAYRMSRNITALEKKFKFKPHTLRCLSVEDEAIGVSSHMYDDLYKNRCTVYGQLNQLWVFKLDNQWFSSPPVTSYILLCMREFARSKPDPKLKTGKMHELLSKNKPSKLFGNRRKINWGVNEGAFGYDNFDETYGVARFEREYNRKSKLALRNRFPNNKLFE